MPIACWISQPWWDAGACGAGRRWMQVVKPWTWSFLGEETPALTLSSTSSHLYAHAGSQPHCLRSHRTIASFIRHSELMLHAPRLFCSWDAREQCIYLTCFVICKHWGGCCHKRPFAWLHHHPGAHSWGFPEQRAPGHEYLCTLLPLNLTHLFAED